MIQVWISSLQNPEARNLTEFSRLNCKFYGKNLTLSTAHALEDKNVELEAEKELFV